MDRPIPYFSSIDEAFRKNASIHAIKPHFELYELEQYPVQDVPEIKPFRLNAYVIGFITSGTARLTINSNEYEIKRGSLYFSSPWDIRAYNTMNDWKGFLLFFTPDYLSQFQFTENSLHEMDFFQPDAQVVLSLEEDRASQIEEWFHRIKTELNTGHPHSMKVLFHYIHILLYKCRELYEEILPLSDKQRMPVPALFLEKLNRYFTDMAASQTEGQVTIQQIADEMHLHPHYVSDLIKKQTGKTATQIIRERYVQEAKTLLRNTKMSVAEISYRLHFKDTSNFTKFFKNVAGVTPKAFREKGPGFMP